MVNIVIVTSAIVVGAYLYAIIAWALYNCIVEESKACRVIVSVFWPVSLVLAIIPFAIEGLRNGK